MLTVATAARPSRKSPVVNSLNITDNSYEHVLHGLSVYPSWTESLEEGLMSHKSDTGSPDLADYCTLFVGHPKLTTLRVTYYVSAVERKAELAPEEKRHKYLVPRPERGVAGLTRESRHGIQSVAALITCLSAQLTELEIDIRREPANAEDTDWTDFNTLATAIDQCRNLISLKLTLICANHMNFLNFKSIKRLQTLRLAQADDQDVKTVDELGGLRCVTQNGERLRIASRTPAARTSRLRNRKFGRRTWRSPKFAKNPI